jgi:hypothetical protein
MYPGCRIGHSLAVLSVTLLEDILNVKERLGRPRWARRDQRDVLVLMPPWKTEASPRSRFGRDACVEGEARTRHHILSRRLRCAFYTSVCLLHQYIQRILSSQSTPLYLRRFRVRWLNMKLLKNPRLGAPVPRTK